MRNVSRFRPTLPDDQLRSLLVPTQRDLLAIKVVPIDRTDVIPSVAILDCVCEVENGTAGPEALLSLGDFEGRARLAIEPLFLRDVGTGDEEGHLSRRSAVDSSVPDREGAIVMNGGVGCDGGDCKHYGAEEGCKTHIEVRSLSLGNDSDEGL
jgi:hypothetical protein